MFAHAEKSFETIADYERLAGRLVAQYLSENPDSQTHEPFAETVSWFLDSDGRWAKATIRRYANALRQEMEWMLKYDSDPDSRHVALLKRLTDDRPASAEEAAKSKKSKQIAHQKKVAAKKKRKAKARKSIPMRELRALRRYFGSNYDDFSNWIAGYIVIASHLGWRPGEILVLRRDGTFLSARAEKHTNNRGLTDTCRIDIAAIFGKSRPIKNANLASVLDAWIADTRKWETFYGGMKQLHDNINGRLANACKHLGIKRVCTYTFRHFAISCMKASGLTLAEIAVIINHATDRTASQHYGKRQHGIKRARRGLRFDIALLPLVRVRSRSFNRGAKPSMN